MCGRLLVLAMALGPAVACSSSTGREIDSPARVERDQQSDGSQVAEPDPCDWEAGGQMGLPRCPNTGDPLPEVPASNPLCHDRGSGATRWIARRPHTPLAITDDEAGVFAAGQACCAPWARLGARYRAIDAYGQVVGEARVDGGEGYDVSRCFELSFANLSGDRGVEIYASADGGWQPPRSAAWVPTDAQREAFARFVDAVEAVSLVEPGHEPRYETDERLPPLAERTLYFEFAREADGDREPTPHRYAVAGGRVLVVAVLAPDERWVLAHLDHELSNIGMGPLQAYEAIAVFDMDGDGRPEIIYGWDEGPGWGQVVLQNESMAGPWEVVARSVSGSTA